MNLETCVLSIEQIPQIPTIAPILPCSPEQKVPEKKLTMVPRERLISFESGQIPPLNLRMFTEIPIVENQEYETPHINGE